MPKIVKFVDLFAGLGGTRIGFEQACKNVGVEPKCVFTAELKPYAIKNYNSNFNGSVKITDITKVDPCDIPDFDYLLGGIPCQAFSFAGKRKGFADTRGTLFFDVERVLKEKKPKGFLIENVEGLVSHDKGRTFQVMYEHLTALGYHVEYKVLSGADFGLAQNRKRIYIAGSLDGSINMESFPEYSQITFGAIQEHIDVENPLDFSKVLLSHYKPYELYGKAIKDKRGGKNNIHSWDLEIRGATTSEQRELLSAILRERRKKKWAKEIGITWMDGMPLTLSQIKTFIDYDGIEEDLDYLTSCGYLSYDYPKELVDGVRVKDPSKEKGYNLVAGKLSFPFTSILDPNGITPTMVATDMSRIGVVDEQCVRKLTRREGLRLFGFPEQYDISEEIKDTEAYDLLGNSICVPVVEAICQKLLEEDRDIPFQAK